MKKRNRNYTYKSIHEERQYGFFWYAGIWRLLRPILIGIGTLLTVMGILGAVWRSIELRFLAPIGSTDVVAFTVESGQSLTRVANNLEKSGLIRSGTVFKYYRDFAGLGQKIQSGNYQLNGTMTMSDIAEQLTMGDGNPLVRNITLIPGWTIEDFANKLSIDNVITDQEHFLNECRSGEHYAGYLCISNLLENKNLAKRRYALEGYLSPNTYEFYVSATDEDIINRLIAQTEKAFTLENEERAEEIGYSMDQILTLASLIEKEAKTGDFARVSAVFHNRLKQGIKLESDVTIHYVTGVRKMNLNAVDLAVESPYNTYKYTGLPPGPICSPSSDAIYAALYPDEVYIAENYLFFCAKDPASGELYFSKTLDEHEQAVAVYAPLWEKWDKERGLI